MSGRDASGPGYTGHVQDAATGFTYMQQRYQDPVLGRFISPDPVETLGDPVRHFNRYGYAYNNPYRFTDPDGRLPILLIPLGGAILGGGINLGVQLYKSDGDFSKVSWGQVGVAAGAGALGGVAGGIAATATTTGGMIAANAISGAAIGAGSAHANALVDGRSATLGEVVQSTGLGGALSAVGGAISGAPAAIQRAVVSRMTQTERVAAQNLVQHIENTSGSSLQTINPRTQAAVDSVGATIGAGDNLQATPEPPRLPAQRNQKP